MSHVRRYVHEAGGRIAIASLPGHETRFKVTLPAEDGADALAVLTGQATSEAERADGTGAAPSSAAPAVPENAVTHSPSDTKADDSPDGGIAQVA